MTHIDPCRETVSLVHVFLDGEVDASTRARIGAHVDRCPPCDQVMSWERKVRELVRSSCAGQDAPAQLRVRILARITQIRITHQGSSGDVER